MEYNLADLIPRLNVGDVVEGVKMGKRNGGSCDRLMSIGSCATVESIDVEKNSVKFVGCGNYHDYKPENGYIVKFHPKNGVLPVINNNPIMSSIVAKFQNIFESDENKMLTKYGIESPIGSPTKEGLDLLLAILYRVNRPEVIAKVKEIQAADEAETAKE